jgi:hypothetical protein
VSGRADERKSLGSRTGRSRHDGGQINLEDDQASVGGDTHTIVRGSVAL